MTEFARSPDALYELLPAVHRSRDAAQGYPLRALLRVINEQVAVVETDIAQLYDDWFIETCADWAVPYIGDLVGYRPVHEAGEPGDPTTAEARLRNAFLLSRREVADTIALRRRKGTKHVLERLAVDVAGWPARAVEFYRRLAWTQHLDHQHLRRGRVIDVRDIDALDRIGGAFDTSAHTIDVRCVGTPCASARYNIPNVGLFVFRTKSYSVTGTPAYCVEDAGPQCYTFSVLGNDAPLYTNPDADGADTHDELALPVPIRRLALQEIVSRHPPVTRARAAYCGAGRSFAIYAPGWPKKGAPQPIPCESVIPADLGAWSYEAKRNTVAVDPVSGRIAFPASQLPKHGVWVDYRYGFSADIGGGEYARAIVQPSLQDMARFQRADLLDVGALALRLQLQRDEFVAYLRAHFDPKTVQEIDAFQAPATPSPELADLLVDALNRVLAAEDLDTANPLPDQPPPPDELTQLRTSGPAGAAVERVNRLRLEMAYAGLIATRFAIYRVGAGATFARLADALAKWGTDKPRYAVIEFVDSGVYSEPIRIDLQPYQTLQVCAADRHRPVLRMLDYMADQPDAFVVSGHAGSRFVLDGMLVSGRGIRVAGPDTSDGGADAADDLCEVVIRHCTLVPGWGLDCDCEPKRPNEPSLELVHTRANVRIEHSILGSIEIVADAGVAEPSSISISDSIVDATRSGRIALGGASGEIAFAIARIVRCTMLGAVEVHAIELAENSLFMGCVAVARRQIGCMRFCYVSPKSRTPRRYHCQPDLVRAAVDAIDPAPADVAAAKASEELRVRPRFDSTRYGHPAYCRLACNCAVEIKRGADDESELGVFHDLFQPQREASLRVRLDEYTPAGMDAGVLFAD